MHAYDDARGGGPRSLRALRAAVLVAGAVATGLFAYTVVVRARHPVELEWMGGAVLDHVERVRLGEPLYVAPSASFIPFLYPPLYYWACALVARALPLLAACRAVSLASTLATAWLVYATSRRLSADRFWSAAAVGLFFAAYSLSGFWYDLERCDSLFVALLAAGAFVALGGRSSGRAAAAGAILGVAFFAKQPAVFVLSGAAAALAAARDRRRAIALGGAGATVVAVGTVLLDRASGGWFSTYVFDVPSRHGLRPELITLFLVVDASQAFSLFAATFAFAAFAWKSARRPPATAPSGVDADLPLYAGVLLGAFAASAFSRWHFGGWRNVLMFWSSFACPAFAYVATRVERAAERAGVGAPVAVATCAAALLQIGRFAYTPGEGCPDAASVREARAVERTVSDLETHGEVVVLGHGHVSSPRHFHVAALMDLERAGFGLPGDLVEGIRARRYAAFVVDDLDELTMSPMLGRGRRSALYDLIEANYFVARRFDDRFPLPPVGWAGCPTWVLRPRARPLVGFDTKQLERRQRIEMALAGERMRLAQADALAPADSSVDIERAASEIDASSPPLDATR